MAMYSAREMLRRRIRLERKEKNLSQAELAKLVGVANASTIANWEGGVSSPDLDKLNRLAEIFDVRLEYLTGLNNSRHSLREDVVAMLKDVEFTAEDIKYKRMFDTCDETAQGAILANLQYYYDRMTGGAEMKEADSGDAIGEDSMHLFLCETDKDYNLMKEKRAELRILKRKSNKSFNEITNYLWKTGYGSELCVFYVISAFGYGIVPRVPSRKLFNDIKAFLNDTYIIVANATMNTNS